MASVARDAMISSAAHHSGRRPENAASGVDAPAEIWRVFSALASDIAYTLELDASGAPIVRWASDGFERVLGYTIEEAAELGGTLALVHPDDAERARARNEALWSGRDRDDILRLVTREGDVRWFRLRGRPVVDPATGVVSVVHGVGTDVTDLMRSEQRFAEIAAITSDAAYVARIDPQTMRLSIEWASDAYTRVMGTSPGEVDDGVGWTRLVHEDDLTLAERAWEEVLAFRPFQLDFRVAPEWAGGAEAKWLRAAGRSEPNPDGTLRLIGTLRDITAEREAAQLDAHLAAIVEATEDAVYSRDREGRITSWNSAAERMFGYSAGQMLGETGNLLVPLGLWDEANEAFRTCLAGQPAQFESKRLRSDGSVIDVYYTISPVRNAAGEVEHVATIARNVTEHHRAHRALVDSEMLLRESQQIAHVGSWRWDAIADTFTGSDEFFRLLGLDPGAVQPAIGLLFAGIHPDDRRLFEQAMTSALSHQNGFQARFRVITPSEEVRWLVSRTQCLLDDAGGFLGAVGTAQDVTDLVTAEQALRESELRFRTLIERTPVGMLMHQDGRMLYANDAAAAILGLPGPADIVGRHARGLARSEDWPAVEQHLEELPASAPAGVTLEMETTLPDGTPIHLSLRSVPLEHEGRPAGLSVIEDVTERHEAHQALLAAHEHDMQAAEALREAGRLKERFLTSVSHELRTPLTPIIGFAGTLRAHRHHLEDSVLDEMLDGIVRNAKQMAAMVDRILDVVQLGSGGVAVEASTVAVRGAVLHAVRTQVEDSTSHWWEFDVADVAVIADPRSLQVVLCNLLANALKYSPERSTVRVTARAEGEEVLLEISDQGPGIPEDIRARVFEPFEQGISQPTGHHGVGLGLFLARSCVTRMGGRLWMEERLGSGSTVVLALPIADQTNDAPTAPANMRTSAGIPQA